jgi:phospholipid/cholesterol/gamma-HCH transport system substrate-binding protein
MFIAIAGILFWLSQRDGDGEASFYTVYFKDSSLSGLQVNSAVTMRGIRVGAVESLMISPKDIQLIQVTLRLQNGTPVKVDTEAVIERNVLTGLSNIDLVKSSQGSHLLLYTKDEQFPVIPEGRSTFGAIQDTLPQLFERTSGVVSRLDQLLTHDNIESISRTIKNVEKLSEGLVHDREQVATTIKHLGSTLQATTEFIKEFKEDASALSQSLNQAVLQVGNETSRMSTAIVSAAEQVQTSAQNYQDPEYILKGIPRAVRGPGE